MFDQLSFIPPPDEVNLPGLLLALLPWAVGQHCDGSDYAIGENLSMNTTDSAHSIHNIDKVGTVESGGSNLYAWVYQDNNGSYYFQMNAKYGNSFWVGLLEGIPGLGNVVSAIDSGNLGEVQPINQTQVNEIKSAVARSNPGSAGSVTGCFTGVQS